MCLVHAENSRKIYQSSCSTSQHFSCFWIFVYLPEIICIEGKLCEDTHDFHLVFHNWKSVTISHILLSVFYIVEYFQEYLKSSIYLPSIFCSTKLEKWCSGLKGCPQRGQVQRPEMGMNWKKHPGFYSIHPWRGLHGLSTGMFFFHLQH